MDHSIFDAMFMHSKWTLFCWKAGNYLVSFVPQVLCANQVQSWSPVLELFLQTEVLFVFLGFMHWSNSYEYSRFIPKLVVFRANDQTFRNLLAWECLKC